MNNRFLPLPDKTKVHLDPADGEIPLPVIRNYRTKLHSYLTLLLQTENENILLGATASRALFLYLNEENKKTDKPLRIGITADNCITLIQAIMSAGCIPVFIDPDMNVQVKIDSVEYLKKQECSFVIWPNFYGPRKRNEDTAKALQKAGIRIIADEAQAFPFGLDTLKEFANKYATIMLFSFGSSKPVAGIGGGGLYMHNPDESFKKAIKLSRAIKLVETKYRNHLKVALKERIIWKYPRITKKFSLAIDRGNDVAAFLERSSMTFDYKPISNMQAYIAYRNLKRLARPKTLQTQLYFQNELKKAVTKIDPHSWDYLRDVEGVAALIALKTPNKRVELFEVLASKGIRATWYFLPLTMLPRCKDFPSEPVPNAHEIADSVSIVAFQWRHSARQKRKVIADLSRALKSVTSSSL